jgi:hypothetical protein
LFGTAAIAAVVLGAQGCVGDRPSRNGVFNENQYIRKDFLVQPGDGNTGDPGWFMKATIVQTSTPNPLANLDMHVGAESSGPWSAGNIVRFAITQDKMQIVDMRETANTTDINNQNTRTPSVENAWPVTNVDLKYRVNLDGEKTNFYEENQELDWQVRQWVKVNFDKNDFSDIAALGPYQTMMLSKCGDESNSSATLVPNSFLVDEQNNYMQWTVSISVPLKLDDKDCWNAYGSDGTDFMRMNRSSVTLNVMYSFVRANTLTPGYVPLVVSEKDNIRHKYGIFNNTIYSRDTTSGLMAANQYVLRYDPNQPITLYLAQGYDPGQLAMEAANPPTGVWRRKGGIVDQTNAIFQKAGAKATLQVLNYNDLSAFGDGLGPARQFGDIRYSMVQWISDIDADTPFIGLAGWQPDPRTGQIISGSIRIAPGALHEYLTQRVEAYVSKVIGADPFSDPPPDPTDPSKTLPSTCTAGQTLPLLPASVQSRIYANSTLYQKMQQYLGPPADGASSAGPSDYVYNHTGDAGKTFYQAYYSLIPYTTYADPMMNQFVTPEDGYLPGMQALLTTMSQETAFQQAMADIDKGGGLHNLQISQSQQGMVDAYNAIDQVRQLWQGHRQYQALWTLPHSMMAQDTTDLISFPGTMSRASRQCVGGKWQSKADWQAGLEQSFLDHVIWHEFGHVMGLEHNFMGSIDKANWPVNPDGTYGKNSSSVMEYSQRADDTYWDNGTPGQTGWLPYDQGAIAWVYGNNLSAQSVGPKPATPAAGQQVGASGQVSATAPWNDPLGWTSATAEKQFLFCSHEHIRYTPLCRQFDLGATPSEITAADIESYEWNYNWRNYRQYFKTWDDSKYSTTVANVIGDTRRFMSMQAWDWSPSELTSKLIAVGINAPAGAANSQLFYQQLTNQFTADVDQALILIAAFHEAVIQQSSGQRPFQTQFDPYYGDVVQQGIAVDKELSFVNWLGLWPFDNYDPTQSAGYSFSSMVIGPGQSGPQQAWSTAGSMLGEKGAWDAFPEYFPTAVALFAHDTHSPVFTGLGFPAMRDWIGGHMFTREQDVLDYFRNIAAQNPQGPNGCTAFASCTYNPMTPQIGAGDIGHSNTITQGFIGPDGRRWVWVYLNDRNIWFFADQDRNSSAYFQVLTYNNDVNVNFTDGNPPTNIFTEQAKIKYMVDAYQAFGGDTGAQ